MNPTDNLTNLIGKNRIFSANEFPFGWWAFCIFLMISSIEPRLFFFAKWHETKNTSVIQTIMEQQEASGESLPETIDQLKERGQKLGLNVEKFDSLGHPYEFVSFSSTAWYVSGSINSADNRSPGWTEMFQATPSLKGEKLGPWPQASLMSELSLDGRYIARLFLSDTEPYRRLIVVNNNAKKSPVWVDTINNVEAFKWMPSGLIYTTSLTVKGRSGAHFYVPSEGVSYFLGQITDSKMNGISEGLDQTRDSSSYNIVLLDVRDDKVEFALSKDNGLGISPEILFQSRKAFQIKSEKNQIVVNQVPLFFSPTFATSSPPNLSPLVEKFLNLALVGPGQTILEEWQDSAAHFEKTPLFVEMLWSLGALYRNASIDFMDMGKTSDSKTLASYAAEYALTLSRRKDAPTWMKNCALWFWSEHQLLNRPLKNPDIKLEWPTQ